jgi:DNA repair protein RecO (recombination protein O)
MIHECEGIIIRQVKILGGRRMLTIITDRYGKVEAGTSVSERGKTSSATALRPYSRASLVLRKAPSSVSVTSGELIKSYYALSEDYDRYVAASLALELTGKSLPAFAPAPDVYENLILFLDMLEGRKAGFTALTNAYIIKLLVHFGVMPPRAEMDADELLKGAPSDILDIAAFIAENPLAGMEKLTIEESLSRQLLGVLVRFAQMHIEVGKIKSLI